MSYEAGQDSEYSILDKIIASKDDQAKRDFDPEEVITFLLKKLSIKESDVLKRRFGLCDTPKETLEAIGNSFKVTRERIRQIENLAIKKIKDNSEFNALVRPVEHVVMSVLDEYGGIMNEEFLLEELFPTGSSPSNDQAVMFILSELIDFRFDKVGPNRKFTKSWKVKTTDLKFVEDMIGVLEEIIGNQGQPLDITTLYDRIKQHLFYKEHSDRINQNVIISYLEVSKALARNPFDEYGLQKWGSVMPRRMNDKIYLVLKKIGKPMHFVDIAKKITEVFKKEAYPPTVHNELILNKHYVLVGRGIYALKEWGYQRGVVSDVIEQILQENTEPVSRDAIVREVLKRRIVKKNTIHLALTNKKRFAKLADGRYVLTTRANPA